VAGRKLLQSTPADNAPVEVSNRRTTSSSLAHQQICFCLNEATGVNDDGIKPASRLNTVIRICVAFHQKFRHPISELGSFRHPFQSGDGSVRVMYLQQMSVVDECFWIKYKQSLHAFVVSHWAEGNDAAGLRLAIASASGGSHPRHKPYRSCRCPTIGSSALFGNFFPQSH